MLYLDKLVAKRVINDYALFGRSVGIQFKPDGDFQFFPSIQAFRRML